MELNDSSTCLIHGQYTNARMGNAKHLTPGFGHKPSSKDTEGTNFGLYQEDQKTGI